MTDTNHKNKIEKSMDIICRLFNKNQITDAYIVGSVAKEDIKKESDIDIIIINPSLNPTFPISADLPPFESLSSKPNENEKKAEELRMKIVDTLKDDIGMEFKELSRKEGISFWYQTYKGDTFHIMTTRDKEFIKDGIKINKHLCKKKLGSINFSNGK